MVDALADLGLPVDDQILVLNILRCLNQRFEHLEAIIQRSSPFSNFLKVRDDLLLEEIHLDTARPSAAPTALYTSTAPPAPKLQSSGPSRPPNNNNKRNKNNNCRNGDNGGKNNSSGGGMVVTLATPLRPPLDPPATTAGPLLHGRRTSTRGRGTSSCTSARYLRDSSARRPSWPRQVTTHPRDSCSSSNNHCTSRPHLYLLQVGHPEMAQAGTSSRLLTPSAP
jgi:hypothetical protein